MSTIFSMDSQELVGTFNSWLDTIVGENQNLILLAKQLEHFDESRFQSWLEDGLTNIVLNGDNPLGAFSPGQLIIGALSHRSWREEILAAVAFTPESTKNRAIRGFVNAFQGIAPAKKADDVSVESGRNNECLTIELLKIVRELRNTLYLREATPLAALRHLLTVQYPSSKAVFNDCLITWRAFSHQVQQPEVENWKNTFEQHRCFLDEHALFIAFGLAIADPTNALAHLFEWAPVKRYRRSLANDGGYSLQQQVKLKRLTDTSISLLKTLKTTGDLSANEYQRIKVCDPTTALIWNLYPNIHVQQIYSAENHGREANLPLSNFRSRPTPPSIRSQVQDASHKMEATI